MSELRMLYSNFVSAFVGEKAGFTSILSPICNTIRFLLTLNDLILGSLTLTYTVLDTVIISTLVYNNVDLQNLIFNKTFPTICTR